MSNSNVDTILSNIKTEILIAYVFSIIFLVIWAISAIWEIIAFAYISYYASLAPEFGYLAAAYVGYAIVLFVFLIISILVFLRINRLYNASKKNDISEMKRLNSIGLAIIALIFNGVIPGILLLIAHGPIEEIPAAAMPPSPTVMPPPPA